MQYGYTKKTPYSFSDAIAKVEVELAKEGFGILTEIDVQATMKKRLDADYEHYVILGACNPKFAHQALQEEKLVGLLLPCNVLVFEEQGEVSVAAILPTVAMSVVGSDKLLEVAKEVETKLKAVVDATAE